MTDYYAVLVLYVSGDNDYGALNADGYGIDRLTNDILFGRRSEWDEEDFHCDHTLFLYESEKARKEALAMMAESLEYISNYESSKHTDVWHRALSREEYRCYLEKRDNGAGKDTNSVDDASDVVVTMHGEKRKQVEEAGDESPENKRVKLVDLTV
jgi:hypothetical protein